MADNYILFQYAPKREDCDGCQKIIPAGDLEVVYQKFYHFHCFFNVFDVLCDKKITSIATEEYMDENEKPKTFVSLEDIDFIGGFNLRISAADLTKIREHLASAKEHKTRYFIPSILRTNDFYCAQKCSRRGSGVGKEFGLLFQNNDYHPKCLSKTRKVNCDSNEIDGYDSLSEDKKKLLDELFKKDNASHFLPAAEVTSDEKYLCATPDCLKSDLKNGYKIIGLRIRYRTKTYHPECFAEMRKVNMDGKEIENYDSLSDYQKGRLRNLFKKSNDFDIPLIEKAKRNDYCTLPDCPAANGQPSKFPWPYTIKFGQLQIKFHGDIYHPKCFKSSQIVNMDVKEFLGYDSLGQKTKQMLEDNAEDIEMDIEEGESSGNDIEGPPAKKSKMEEMSEPIILQMNTLNESYNAGVEPQTVNDREEREGNKKSGNLIAENVVSGNEIEEIPEIKKEVKAEPEIITLDDDDETDFVKVEPQNDIRRNGKEIQPTVIQEPIVNAIPQLFRLPSEDFIESTLDNLKIPFTREAYAFYSKFKYTKIPTTATLCITFPISSFTDSFFKCLSLFFTGEEKYYYGIKPETQLYIFNNFKTFGTIDGIDFSKVDESSPEFQKLHDCKELTNTHFTFICAWLKCRIGIYSNGLLSGKYGNWNGNEPIFLIENNNGFYKPVLSLI
uniref:Uncharacterized protein n=1 Tax=Panagrolaimus davidi TaxID=227884 RepID=A0A914Q770_9BILA